MGMGRGRCGYIQTLANGNVTCGIRCDRIYTITVFGRLELELCERKILLPGWWSEAGAGEM